MIDFWTYTCVNCIRTFPFLNEWNEKYKDDGLKIIGVHTPEFEFEKVKKNIVKIIEIEKMRRNKQILLPDFISKLNNEFEEFISNS